VSDPPSGRQFTINCGAARATVVEVGGGLRAFAIGDHPVLDGYERDHMASAGRGQVLIPWPNRIDGGRYAWNGETQQLPINEVERSNAIHGLVRFVPWTATSTADDRVEMAYMLWPSPGYPFTLDLRVAYQISETTLVVTTTVRNVGSESAPFGAGQHPYLLPPAGVSIDACELVVPAQRYLETDDRGLPTEARAVGGSGFDFRGGRLIGSTELDTAFTDLARDDDGRAHVLLACEARTVTIWMDERHRYVQVFTGDTLPAPRRRNSVAIEPMTCPPNAFATGTDVAHLSPDETLTTTWGLVVDE
jgi:aldose 1-epimerase